VNRILPPVWLLIALVLIAALHRYLPVASLVPAPWHYAGIVVAASGFALGAWSTVQFRRAHTTIVPFQESTSLIVRGPYRFTRNPIYLSMVLLLLGAAVFAGSLSPFAVVPAFLVIIQTLFISAEERMLAQKFGDSYRAYFAKVRRWL